MQINVNPVGGSDAVFSLCQVTLTNSTVIQVVSTYCSPGNPLNQLGKNTVIASCVITPLNYCSPQGVLTPCPVGFNCVSEMNSF